MPRKDPNHEAFKAAINATQARIRDDRRRAPPALSKLFAVIGDDLFKLTLNATRAWRDAGLKSSDWGKDFQSVTKTTVARYIGDRRIETAEVARKTTDFFLTTIAEKVGFNTYRTFFDTYKRVMGKPPSEERRQLPPPLLDDETGLLAVRGLLEGEELVRFVQDLLKLHPSDADRVREALGVAKSEPVIIVDIDGAGTDQLKAEALWMKIRDLTFEEQCQRVRGVRFHSDVFFDLLREKSKLEGRKCRRRGIELAELLLVSLERSDEVFGERIHDLRALAWSWIGNAHRLALDFLAAHRAFEHAEREWSTPRSKPDRSVLATLYGLKAILLMVRRQYAAATEDLVRACSLFRELDRPVDEARALIKRAAVQIYAHQLGDAVDDLHEAARLIDGEEEKELAFAVYVNLANALARAGHARRAAKELDRARQLEQAIDDPLGSITLDGIAGFISEVQDDHQAAKRFYLVALAGSREAGDERHFGIFSVALMVVYAREDDWGNVVSLAAEAVPVLASQELHDETLALIKLLAKSLETRDIPRQLLTDLQVALRQDPLAM